MDYFATGLSILTALSVIISMWATFKKIKKDDTQEKKESENAIKRETEKNIGIRTDLEYLKRRADENSEIFKEIVKKLDDQAERLTRVEESVKSAHKRIDKIEGS